MSVLAVLRKHPIVNARKETGHLHYFTKETALDTLTYAGYETLDWFYTSGSADLPKTFNQFVIKYPRRALFKIHPDITVRILGGFSLLVLAK
jgi:hypothetical protein